jgi:LysM repeat protein
MIKESLWLSLASAAVLVLASCASQNPSDLAAVDTGPFDEQGNYRDEWADDPTKWRRPSGGSKPAKTRSALNDQPPASSVPLVASSSRTAAVTPKSSSSTASTTTRKAKASSQVASKAKSKPKTKPAATTRYTVKGGDSLYTIAQRNKTTVSALQKANRISGSLIRPGQTLVIPRR